MKKLDTEFLLQVSSEKNKVRKMSVWAADLSMNITSKES